MKKLLAALAIALVMIAPANALDMSKFNAEIDQTNFVVNSGCSGTLHEMLKRQKLEYLIARCDGIEK